MSVIIPPISPHLCGIYFRDKKFRSQRELRRLIESLDKQNPDQAAENVFIPPSWLRTATYIPYLVKADLNRADATSLALERLMNNEELAAHEEMIRKPRGDDGKDEVNDNKRTFFELHSEFVNGKGSKAYCRLDAGDFSIEDFIREVGDYHHHNHGGVASKWSGTGWNHFKVVGQYTGRWMGETKRSHLCRRGRIWHEMST